MPITKMEDLTKMLEEMDISQVEDPTKETDATLYAEVKDVHFRKLYHLRMVMEREGDPDFIKVDFYYRKVLTGISLQMGIECDSFEVCKGWKLVPVNPRPARRH